jgi:hypothetical protein
MACIAVLVFNKLHHPNNQQPRPEGLNLTHKNIAKIQQGKARGSGKMLVEPAANLRFEHSLRPAFFLP